MLSNGKHGLFGNLIIVRDIESQEVGIVGDERNESRVGEVPAVGERQALNAIARSQGHDAAIVDRFVQGGEIQALDEVAIVKIGVVDAECAADEIMFVPCCARRPVPENVDGITRPSFACQHDVEDIGQTAELGKYGDQDLVW